jgi:cytochrome P450
MIALDDYLGSRAWKPLPGLGYMLALRTDPLGFLVRATQQYGDLPELQVGPQTLYLVSKPEHVQYVLRDNYKNFAKHTPVYKAMATFLGRGILTSEGDFWLAQRRIIQPAFQRQKLAGFAQAMSQATLQLLDNWRRKLSPHQPVDIAQEMMNLTLQIVIETLLGSHETGDTEQIAWSVDVFQKYANSRVSGLPVPPAWLPTKENRDHKAALAFVDKITYDLIDKRLKNPDEGSDVLSVLVRARDENGNAMPRKQIRDEVLTLMLAGHDTTANTLAWTLYLLASVPSYQHQLVAEVQHQCGDRVPGVEDLSNLPNLRNILNESLRLYPPAWVTGRNAVSDDVIDGKVIKQGDVVLVSPYVTHRRPELWSNPEGFDPSRWEHRRISSSSFDYYPFGGGAHRCIGDNFALLEATIILATFAQRCWFELVPGQTIVPEPMITMRPKHGVMMWVKNQAPKPTIQTS